MHYLIQKLYEKWGYKEIVEVPIEEREQLFQYQEILSKEKVEIEDLLKFCKDQKATIEKQFRNFDNPQQKNERLQVALAFYGSIIEFIEGPMVGREYTIKFLENLINEK